MALKMMYFAVYLLAILAALVLGKSMEILGGNVPAKTVVAWTIAAAAAAVTVRTPMLAAQRPAPVVSRHFYDAGLWVRANVGTTCVDYLVEDSQTAYWLHLAVLGNPRASQRSAEADRHNMRDAFARWIPAEGLPYAIADLRLLPDEIRTRVEVVKGFGEAAVIKRPGGAECRSAFALLARACGARGLAAARLVGVGRFAAAVGSAASQPCRRRSLGSLVGEPLRGSLARGFATRE